MYNFFVESSCIQDSGYLITGTDYNHIANVLRMKIGDKLLVSCNSKSDLCQIESFAQNTVVVKVIESDIQNTELPVNIVLLQGLPKSDKLELIIQKSVELGVTDIIPVQMKRCVVKFDDKKKASKQTRWQAIAESAAKQSKRNVIPNVHSVLAYKQALDFAKRLDILLVPYENELGIVSAKNALKKIKSGMTVGILIGPEGGFDDKEISLAREIGDVISLGKRILRTETAAITATAMCMLYAEMNLYGE